MTMPMYFGKRRDPETALVRQRSALDRLRIEDEMRRRHGQQARRAALATDAQETLDDADANAGVVAGMHKSMMSTYKAMLDSADDLRIGHELTEQLFNRLGAMNSRSLDRYEDRRGR